MFLALVIAIDIEGFCSMANHLHLIVRNRPDVAAKWSPEQFARKWLQLCPPYTPGMREVAETASQADLDAIPNNPGRVEHLRLRLSNPSWSMRFLTESLARFANREDQCAKRTHGDHVRALAHAKLCRRCCTAGLEYRAGQTRRAEMPRLLATNLSGFWARPQ
jgi:hypothetical protein